MSRSRLAVNCLVAFLFLVIGSSPVFSQNQLVLATGGKEGTYFALGEGIKRVLEREIPNLDVVVVQTEGSVQNAELMTAGAAQLALMQNDVAYNFYKGERIFKFPSDKVKGLAALYTEIIQIVCRKELGITRLSDLRGKTIAVGPRGSGTEFNAAAILDAVGIRYEDIEERFISFEEAKYSILAGTIDAAFITAGIPTAAVRDMAHSIVFIPIDIGTIDKIRRAYPYFVSASIPATSYPSQNKEIPSVGVRALLVASANLKPRLAKQITAAIFKRVDMLAEAHPVASEVKLRDARWGMPIPLHRGAQDYYEGQGLAERDFSVYLRPFFLPLLVCLVVVIVLIKYRQDLRTILTRRVFIRLLLVFIIMYVLATIGIHLFEREVNQSFRTLYESFWSTMVFVLSGLDLGIPVTKWGRLFSALILISSMGIFGMIVAQVGSILARKGEVKMSGNISGHIVICNWNEKGERVVHELHSTDGKSEIPIIVITKNRPSNEQDDLRTNYPEEYSNVEFRESDPSLEQVLEAANAHRAKSVIILADEKSSDPDAASALIALSVKHLWGERVPKERRSDAKGQLDVMDKQEDSQESEEKSKSRKPHIVAEAVNHRRMESLKNAGVDEVICASDFGIGILAQCALYRKLSECYQQLLCYSDETCELYLVDDPNVSNSLDGKTFQEAAHHFIENRNPDNPTILIGFRRGDKIVLNPRESGTEKEYLRFRREDCPIFLSYRCPKPDDMHLGIGSRS
ncbi:MAG: TAXI family TRAP transporter solute-binding subunit [Candidatus Eisenbacteria bacterium]|nr:TAXI family TRAP transporter solute-binding subunit [Candidatus Eisenbacteria bacterium]